LFIESWRPIRANPEAELASDASILINHHHTIFPIPVNGRSGAGFNARGIGAVQTGKGEEILKYPVIADLRSVLIYIDQIYPLGFSYRGRNGVGRESMS